MNYPVWDVSFGAGLLVAIVSITHVFVSHFAIGGGLFLVLTEHKAYRENDTNLLAWLKTHTRFFVLVTVVFGAISGVGIWFTIGLTNPSATSSLIHSFVWGWAIEWVFFFVEITAALLYMYGWDRVDRKTHLWLGWIYFIAAYLSLVVINGIITYMLTPGAWIDNREFWSGFFNPTYFPSLFIRSAFSFALAGLYAMVTASLIKNLDLKAKVVKWSVIWIVPAFFTLPFFAWWYINNIPQDLWASATGLMPTATDYTNLIPIFSIITFILALVTLFMSKKVHFIYTIVMLGCAFVTMWSFEFIREAVRKPYVITNYMYANGLYYKSMEGDGGFTQDNIDEAGILASANWTKIKSITPENQINAGKEIFRVECQSCHTHTAYRGLQSILQEKQWDAHTVREMLAGLDLMNNYTMPPFVGTDEEREALAAFLVTLYTTEQKGVESESGMHVYKRYCISCHSYNADNSLFSGIKDLEEEEAIESVANLKDLVDEMPDLRLTENEQQMLVSWVREQFNSDN